MLRPGSHGCRNETPYITVPYTEVNYLISFLVFFNSFTSGRDRKRTDSGTVNPGGPGHGHLAVHADPVEAAAGASRYLRPWHTPEAR